MNEPLIWVIGSGGLLGCRMLSALSERFPRAHFWQPTLPHFSWTDPNRFAEELSHEIGTFASNIGTHKRAWALLWCAGKGSLTSSPADLEPEWWGWSRLLELLSLRLDGAASDVPGCIFLASSAGGIYGGNPTQLLTEETSPYPITAYGAHKLRMEEALRNWAEASSNLSCLIGRISTLYGPGHDLRKPQGIISHMSRCLIYRRPISIYVPLDTRRDYLFVDDCARQIAASLARLIAGQPRTVLKIFAGERLTSVAQIVGVFFHIAKHRPLLVSRQSRVRQPISLQFRSQVWRDLKESRSTELATGIHLLHAHQLALFQRGLLLPPL